MLYGPSGDCHCYLDVLDDHYLGRFNVHDTAVRRQRYEQAGQYLRRTVTASDGQLEPIDGGHLVRVVLDVERGALFFYRLRNRGFLVGVTLDQSRVDATDRKLSRAANDLLVLWGGRPDDDFYRVPDHTYDEQSEQPDHPTVRSLDEARDRRSTG